MSEAKENHIGKERNIPFSATKNVSIFPVIKPTIRRILTACSAIALCMLWGIGAEEILSTQKKESRTVQTASFPIKERISVIS